jgi:hypothetical protein
MVLSSGGSDDVGGTHRGARDERSVAMESSRGPVDAGTCRFVNAQPWRRPNIAARHFSESVTGVVECVPCVRCHRYPSRVVVDERRTAFP